MRLRFANKHPFLFCAMAVSCATALGGGIAGVSGNVDYGSISFGIVILWICIGFGYAMSKGLLIK